jgi:Na+/proline symporter
MSPQPTPDVHARAESPSSLRAALMAPPVQRPSAADATPRPAAEDVGDRLLLPTASELLASSTNLQRLCDSYHNTRRRMVERGRRQRLGIAAMVCALAVAAVVLFRQGSLPDTTVVLLMVTVGIASAAGLGVLGALWLREDRRLRQAQGDRLQRALQFNCSLPEDNLRAFRRLVPPEQAFFDVYNAWRLEHPDRRGALASMLGSVGQRRGRASA